MSSSPQFFFACKSLPHRPLLIFLHSHSIFVISCTFSLFSLLFWLTLPARSLLGNDWFLFLSFCRGFLFLSFCFPAVFTFFPELICFLSFGLLFCLFVSCTFQNFVNVFSFKFDTLFFFLRSTIFVPCSLSFLFFPL